MKQKTVFSFGDGTWVLGNEPVVMGIVNVTPDSFSDGGRFLSPDDAVRHGLALVRSGAGMLDVGGESTRPGAEPVPADEEIRRVVPVIRLLAAETDVPISVDTSKAKVAEAALGAGAAIVNDVSALERDPAMAEVLSNSDAGCILMHMRGTPPTMQTMTDYDDVVAEVVEYFRGRMNHVRELGLAPERFVLDPGIGFGKTAAQSLALIARVAEFRELGRPVLLGPSRKSFIGAVLEGAPVESRTWGTAAAVACGVFLGADIVRVHDVGQMTQVAAVAAALGCSR